MDEEQIDKEDREGYYLDWLHSDEGEAWIERYHPELVEDKEEEPTTF